jgi:putative colanic acid biosynthesis UDP-glucose lipid carrier transferase
MIISILGFYLFEYQIYNISYFIIYLIVGWIVVLCLFILRCHRFTAPIEIFQNCQARRSVSFNCYCLFFRFQNNMLLVKNSHIVYNFQSSGFHFKIHLVLFSKKIQNSDG